ncbi:carboxypepD_reg-like domain protein [Kordia sp. SMS9]|uniref:carboxypeptidase-like regulatory domain-containing protein n=1 Tax=Kordia sp. SMS9 TaxID=2282170 RepID=UPI000E0DF912|nr:carboxypeptidase-like regulatory domain-containing protein [Kordia sp. SMS9]AXG69954.1 carboxypepD_reg-like domain protein [Kordia sp. SMS9]
MKPTLLLFSLLFSTIMLAQDAERNILRGAVVYRDVKVTGVNIVNNTTSKGTTTNKKGEFEILAKKDDILIFSSVQYTIKEIVITDKIIENNRLVVEVKEKVEALDEVVISPENRDKFLDFQEEEIVKYKDYQFADDRYSEVRNEALSQMEFRGANVLGLVGMLVNAIFKGSGKNKEKPKAIYERTSFNEVRYRYKDEFFTDNLGIPEDKISAFLYYCDDQMPSEDIFLEKNEFLMIDFMVKHSKEYLNLKETKN